MDFDNAEKLKAFLKAESIRLGISINNTYNTYFARILLERINKWSNNEIFVKGSFSEYGHIGRLVRPITDVDLVSIDGSKDTLELIFKSIYMCNKDKGVNFELAKAPTQTKTGIYKVSFVANFGKIEHHMSMDFQEKSNTIYERDYKVIPPIFKGDYYFGVCMPTLEEYLAEKLCIVLENNKEDVINTRVKDFYDIWKLLECEYVANKVEEFFCRMIVDRNKTNVDTLDVSFLNEDYIERHQQIWDEISQKYEFLDKSIDLEHAVHATRSMLNHEVEYFQRVRKRY